MTSTSQFLEVILYSFTLPVVPIHFLAMANIGNHNIAFVDLSNGDDISGTSLCIRVANFEILDVIPLEVIHYPVDFI